MFEGGTLESTYKRFWVTVPVGTLSGGPLTVSVRTTESGVYYVHSPQIEDNEHLSEFTENISKPNVNDYSLNNYHAELDFNNSPEWEYDNSLKTGVYNFKGDNTRIKTLFKTNLAFQDNDPITFMGWIYIEKYPLSVDYRTGIFGSNEYYTKTNAGGFGYVINEREVRSVLGDSTKTTEVSVTRSILPEKTWHFIATTYDGEKMIIYLNGNKVKSANVESWRSNNLDFLIGHGTQSGWQRTFNGKISEIRIYKRALSAEEIKIIYYKNLNN